MSENPTMGNLVLPVKMSEYQTPEMKTIKRAGSKFISYGEDNDYPSFLLKLYNNSAEHSAIINSKVDYILGNGVELDNLPDEVVKVFESSDIDNLMTKLSLDDEIFGGFAFEVVRNRVGKIVRFDYVDFTKIRVGEDELLYSEDWSLYRPNAKSLQKWNKDGKSREVYYYIGKHSRYEYPLPKYAGSIPAIETDIEIQSFHLNHVKNGFFVPIILNFNNGVPTEAEQEDIEKSVEDKFCSPTKAGRFMLTFNENPDNAVTVERLQTDDLDKKFEVLAKQIQQKILIGHRVISPMLFGVKTEGQLGGRKELVEAYELFKTTYIIPTRNVLSAVFEEVLEKDFGILEINFIDQYPIEEIVEKSEIVKTMTDEEIRDEAGLEPLNLEGKAKFIRDFSKMPQELQKAVTSQMTREELFKLLEINTDEL